MKWKTQNDCIQKLAIASHTNKYGELLPKRNSQPPHTFKKFPMIPFSVEGREYADNRKEREREHMYTKERKENIGAFHVKK